jgi:hypothetical protein
VQSEQRHTPPASSDQAKQAATQLSKQPHGRCASRGAAQLSKQRHTGQWEQRRGTAQQATKRAVRATAQQAAT